MLTSFGQALSPAELKQTGIEAYLVKPVKQSRLFDCLVNAMGKTVAQRVLAKTVGSAASAAITSEPNPKLEKVRILLAEDNIVNQKVALGQLRKLRYTADAVANGLEVLEALKRISLRHHSHGLSDAGDGRIRSDTSHPQTGAKFGCTLSLEIAGLHHCHDGQCHAGRPRKVPCGGNG